MIKQKLDTPDKAGEEMRCSCAFLRRAVRRVTHVYDLALRPAGIHLTQYSLLVNVSRSGGSSISELAQLLAMDRTTLTRNLKPLEQSGWVKITAGTDKRSRCIKITSTGRRILKKARPYWQQAEKSFRSNIGVDKVNSLHKLLGSILLAE